MTRLKDGISLREGLKFRKGVRLKTKEEEEEEKKKEEDRKLKNRLRRLREARRSALA